MEGITDLANDRNCYEYLPAAVYSTVMNNLTMMSPPKYSETLEFHVRTVPRHAVWYKEG